MNHLSSSELPTPRPKVIAVLTSHNRRELTVRCLERLGDAGALADVELSAVLVDDGSTDGTASAVSSKFPWVAVERGDGSLFWNRGMHRAIASIADERFDYLLWVNDDTDLLVDALQRLLAVSAELEIRERRPVIVVGATSDPDTGNLTYGGMVERAGWRHLLLEHVHSGTSALQCDTMNGNVVLFPAPVFRDVGNLDPAFEHSMGDIDYGLRTKRRGHPIYVAPGFMGQCRKNPWKGTEKDPSLPLSVRWRKMLHRKALPPRSWLQLTRRHCGILWPLYFAWPYAKLLSTGAMQGVIKRRKPASDA
jgi:GT2 family glycosyltransferase